MNISIIQTDTHERFSGDQEELYKILRSWQILLVQWGKWLHWSSLVLWKRWQVYNSVVVEYALLLTTYPMLVYIDIE